MYVYLLFILLLHENFLGVTSRMIIWPLVEQIRLFLVPLFHGLHRRLAAQC